MTYERIDKDYALIKMHQADLRTGIERSQLARQVRGSRGPRLRWLNVAWLLHAPWQAKKRAQAAQRS